MTKYRGIFAIVCILALPLSLMSQTQGKGKMRGTVVDQDSGLPLEGVTVRLFSLKAREYRRPDVTTDKEGKWGAYFIKDGMWTANLKGGLYAATGQLSVTLDPRSANPTGCHDRQDPGHDCQTSSSDGRQGESALSEKKYDEARGPLNRSAESPEIYIIPSIAMLFRPGKYEKAVGDT